MNRYMVTFENGRQWVICANALPGALRQAMAMGVELGVPWQSVALTERSGPMWEPPRYGD